MILENGLKRQCFRKIYRAEYYLNNYVKEIWGNFINKYRIVLKKVVYESFIHCGKRIKIDVQVFYRYLKILD